MKIISFNVNGLRACLNKGFADFLKEYNPDIIGLQETKMQIDQVDFSFEGYYEYYFSAIKKGYSSTAVFTKTKPLSVRNGIGVEVFDNEGRVITLEFENFYFVNAYVPNSKDGLTRIDERMQFEDAILNHLNSLDKPVVYTGDLNVAPEEIDLKNPKTNRKSAGFSDEERAKFRTLVSENYFDCFRFLYPEVVKYTWWSYRANARANNSGWRIDHFILSNNLKEKVKDMSLLNEVYGSDHCPIELIIDL